jgi:hypothetical protein
MTKLRDGLLLLFLLLGVLAAGSSGCGGGDGDLGPAPQGLRVDGDYELVSSYDLTVGSVLPEPVASYTQVIVGLRSDPAGTMFQLLDDAGVPLASDLTSALPSVVSDKLKSWMNEALSSQSYGGVSASSQLDALAAALQTVTARPDVASRLSLSVPDAHGDVEATHTLEELRYSLFGGEIQVTVPIVTASTSGLITVQAAPAGRVTAARGGEDAHLFMGDHAFGVEYGTYAFQALDQGVRARFGTDVRGVLGGLVDCASMATSVSSRCLFDVCVGHQQSLEAICEAGLDLAYDQLRGQVQDLRLDALRLSSGEAQLWDAPAAGGPTDSRVDRVAAGTWNASLDFGMGPRAVTGTFTGTRVAWF